MSLHHWITHRLDWALFALLAWLVFAVGAFVLRRQVKSRRLGALHVLVVTGVCSLAYVGADWVGGRERERMQAAVTSLGPTYAQELSRLGHSALKRDTPPDSPLYRNLCATESRWLASNPQISQIYTFRLERAGGYYCVVDAGFDRDGNGRLEGEHETSKPLGAPCPANNIEMVRALCGISTFQQRAVVDEWGTWISAFHPLRDADGRIDGAVAVEFDAREWVQSEAAFRMGTLGLLFLGLLVYLVAVTTTQFLRGEIDRRKEIEDEHRKSEERLRAILDNDPDFIGLVGPDGKLLEVNPAGCRLIGSGSKEELLGKSLEAALRPVQPERLRALCRPESGLAPVSAEYEIQGRRGSPRWVHSHSVPLGSRFGFSRTYLVVTRDVHDQKVARQEAERLQKELIDASRVAGMAEITTGILHNIGNVINTANIACSTVQSRLDELGLESLSRLTGLLADRSGELPRFFAEDTRAKHVVPLLLEIERTLSSQRAGLTDEMATLGRALDHVKNVIHSQQSLARSSSVYELIDPREVIEDALLLNAETLDHHGILVERDFAQMIALNLDRHKILQVLINLVTNAKDAMKDVPQARRMLRISVATQRIANRIHVTFDVRDQGVGIPKENLTKIFHHGFSTRTGGHGFGLHSSALAATEMGGTLTAQSDGPGKGAVFVLRVPTLAQTEVQAA